jgi:hypothetical protein
LPILQVPSAAQGKIGKQGRRQKPCKGQQGVRKEIDRAWRQESRQEISQETGKTVKGRIDMHEMQQEASARAWDKDN